MPVNTFTAVRSASCIYLAGITLKLAPCGLPLSIVIKRSGAVLQGLLVLCTSSLSTRSFYTPSFKLLSQGVVFWLALIGVVSWSAHLGLSEIHFYFFFLMKCGIVCGTQTLTVGGSCFTPEGKHGKCSLPPFPCFPEA